MASTCKKCVITEDTYKLCSTCTIELCYFKLGRPLLAPNSISYYQAEAASNDVITDNIPKKYERCEQLKCDDRPSHDERPKRGKRRNVL